MYLKSITLKGFKSFPDRTRLEFGPGVSVVVGPNGSGKSNITDAVLWAMGEQSPLAIRGQSMQDVIFAGAPGRQGSRAAEVELVLDDSEGLLGLGVPEVSLVRRLDRNGEGEYRLAGARCRLVEIIEMLSDTGLGKEMHSVISQGRVESIVTSKPRDRRLLIEEAAGLGKHRKRRRRAQLKLARTEENLDRALDVEREARSRLRPLKRQAEAAELHARLERQGLELRWELARDEVRLTRSELEHAQTAAAQARAGREKVERELAEVAARREAAEEALATRSAKREELSRRCFTAEAALERVSDRQARVRAAAHTLAARIERDRPRLSELERDPEAQARPDERRIAELEERLAELGRAHEAEIQRELEALQDELTAAGEAAEGAEQRLQQAQLGVEQLQQRSSRASEELRAAERDAHTARAQAARAGAELAASNQFLETVRSGLPAAVALADELDVEPGFELALSAVLDGRLGAAVAEDRETAGRLLDSAGGEGGRALVLGGGERRSPARADNGPPPTANAEPLSSRVRGSSAGAALARELLADAWVLEALEDLPEDFSGTAVTRAGRVWSPRSRELRQAPEHGQDRVLAERNRRQELIRASEAAAGAELAAVRATEAAQQRQVEIEEERERALSELRTRQNECDELRERERRLRQQIERRRESARQGVSAGERFQLEAELNGLRAEQQRLERERAARARHAATLRTALAEGQALHPTLIETTEALEELAASIGRWRAHFERELQADREAGEHVAAELRACAQQEARLQAKLHGASEELTTREVQLQRVRDRAAEQQAELASIAAQLELEPEPAAEELGAEERQALQARLERLTKRRIALGPVNPLAQQEYTQALEHVEELERQRADLETAMRELEKLIADTDKQIRETFEHTFAATAKNFEEVAARLFPGGRARLRLVSERDRPAPLLGGGTAEGPDLQGPEAESADAEAEEQAEEHLGVEIEISPAGKAMKQLTLLSGGEKSLTALAFLFAVFLARPCPFYILDEVEAALDDPNIDRFLELLRGYSTHAQFIVVTHQKRTMDAADSLYGVSMSGDGVSKVISRRLPPAQLAA